LKRNPLARAGSSASGWLGFFFGRSDVRRLLVAIACSLAIHEIVAWFITPIAPSTTPEPERPFHVTVARIERKPLPTPSPTPKPTPRPTPRVVMPSKIVASTPVPSPVPLTEGKAAHKEPIKHHGAARPKPPHVRETKPIWDIVPMGAQGAGAQRGSGAGSLSQRSGTGTGTGAQGNGEGGGSAPCGAVDFSASGPAQLNPSTGYYERNNVVAIVHLADGTEQRVALDWTWRYRNEADDPFNPGSSAPMYFQFPPKNLRPGEPETVQYIMRYSAPNGTSILKGDVEPVPECPNIPPPPQRAPAPESTPGATGEPQ
jgi:hypothetical protein